MGPYDDILDLDRPKSVHPSMPRADRAKQFMPFASLRGFDDVIDDRGTLRDKRLDLGEDEREILDDRLRKVESLLADGMTPLVKLHLFTPDPARTEEWGTYRDVTGHAEKIRLVEREIRIDGRWYSLDMADDLSLI